MFWKLLIAFTVIPAVELYLLVSLGQWIGPLSTVLLIVLTGLFGAALAKQEGTAVLRQLREDLGRGLPPASHLVEGVMVLAGGLLLLTPGLLTDLTGFSLIIPFSRRLISPPLTRYLAGKMKLRVTAAATDAPQAPRAPSTTPRPSRTEPSRDALPADAPFDHPVS
jgi:UPF0716 protein FxsA